MSTIKESLNTICKEALYIDLRIPQEVGSRSGINASHRGTIKEAEIIICSAKSGEKISAKISYKNVDSYLKEFIESHEFICSHIKYIVTGLLAFDIRVKIKHDLYTMERVVSLQGVKVDRVSICNKEDIYKVAKHYYKYIEYVKKHELYADIMVVENMIAYGDYFGIELDTDTNIIESNLLRAENRCKEILVDINSKTGWELNTREDVVEKIASISDTPVYMNMRALIRSLNNIDDYVKKIMIEYEEEYTRNVIMINKLVGRHTLSIKNNSVQLASPVSILSNNNINDAIHTNSSKNYYISIDGSYIDWVVAEKEQFNRDVSGVDYHKLMASELNDLQPKEVSVQLRYEAKAFTFVRGWGRTPKQCKTMFMSLSKENGNVQKRYEELVSKKPEFKSRPVDKVRELVIKSLARVAKNIEENIGTGMTLHHIEGSTVVFRISNKVNPYEAMKIIIDSFNCTGDIGVRAFDTVSIGNSYRELRANSKTGLNIETNKIVYKLPIEKIQKCYRHNSKKQYRNIVKDVLKDMETI